MAKKQLIVCDNCENEVDGSGGVLRFNYGDARKGSKVADLCGTCADALPGRSTGRRGRKPKSVEA